MNYAEFPIPHWTDFRTWREKPDWWRECVIRHDYKCKDCNNGEKILIVHHIDKNPNNDNQNNLVLLCRRCHSIRHGQKDPKSPVLDKLKEYAPDKKIRHGILSIIAEDVSLSRERVRQLAKAYGYQSATETTRQQKTVKCWVCGKRFLKSNYQQKNLCSSDCNKFHFEQKYWCIYQCENCHYYFKNRRKLQKLRGRRFCGKTCQGKWIGRVYGWSSESNNGKTKCTARDVIKDFKEPFTVLEFRNRYGYKSRNSAYVRIINFVDSGVLEGYKVRGLYRVKRNKAA